MTWQFDGAWHLHDGARIVGTLRHDGEQYVDGEGHPLAREFRDACAAIEKAAGGGKR